MIHSVGLRYHKEETFIDRAAEVTGVILQGGRLLAPFRQHKKMREAKQLLAHAGGDERHALLGRVGGIRGHIKQITSKN